jgi:cellulose synthase/poly-beta-1,6-N-acetylglucosamine synthase-like glycosyltransferase
VIGALITAYVILVLPAWFKKPNPVIFVPCGFGTTALYVFYINYATGGQWFLTLALPLTAAVCAIVTAVVTLIRYVRRGKLYIFGGASLATGYRMSSNPFANLITGWYTVYWNLMNELSNRVRSELNLSSMLTGTGFCFKTGVLPKEGWRTRTFVEDLEFAFFRNLDGYRVAYVQDAVFYDEQPVSAKPMLRQLNRWATGGLQILRLYGWRWIKALCSRPSFRLFDCFAIIALGATGSMLLLLNVIALNWRFGAYFVFLTWASALLSTALSRLSVRSLWLPIVTFPFFTVILSGTVIYSALFPQRTWKPIEHGN